MLKVDKRKSGLFSQTGFSVVAPPTGFEPVFQP